MKWKKLGRIFNPAYVQGRTWMKEFAQCTSTIIFDDFVRVYFSCRPPRDKDGQYVSYTAFADFDRKDLTKIIRVADEPILDLGGLGQFDEFAVYPTSVIKLDDTFYLYYAGWTRMSSVPFDTAIGVATSKDGEKFTRVGSGPIISRSINEPFLFSGPKVRRYNNKLYMFYLGGTEWIADVDRPEIIYKIRVATSECGLDWKRDGKNIIGDILENECQAGPDVFFKDGEYHMYFSYRYGLDFRNNNRGYRVGYAKSENLFDWIRDDDNVGIGLSESGWDSTDMHYPHVFECDNKTYMLYNGNDFGKYGFGLAELVE